MESLNFLTWNVYKKTSPIHKSQLYTDLLAELQSREIDVVVLQESFKNYLGPLLTDYAEIIPLVQTDTKGLRILYRKKHSVISQIGNVVRHQPHRMLCAKVDLVSGTSFNLIGIHLYSKVGRTPHHQNNENRAVPGLIRDFEQPNQANSTRTLVVGDFNYSPFDPFMVDPLLLNALGDKQLIESFITNAAPSGLPYPFFYNPTWNLLGDQPGTGGAAPKLPVGTTPYITQPGGSYFWQARKDDEHYWNMLDGVLLRPSLMHQLNSSSLQVLTFLNSQPLLATNRQGGWTRSDYSDHLPVVFTLNL